VRYQTRPLHIAQRHTLRRRMGSLEGAIFKAGRGACQAVASTARAHTLQGCNGYGAAAVTLAGHPRAPVVRAPAGTRGVEGAPAAAACLAPRRGTCPGHNGPHYSQPARRGMFANPRGAAPTPSRLSLAPTHGSLQRSGSDLAVWDHARASLF
jgi:hypothetical protein